MKIIAVRHCRAAGQEREAPLTKEGVLQSKDLAYFLAKYQFDRVISSPFKRAIDTIKPYADMHDTKIELDERLSERILSTQTDPDWDWKTHLERTYKEEHLKFPGGESTFEAKQRVHSLIQALQAAGHNSVLFVTHGNLLSLLINLYEPSFGFKEWELLSNPDVYLIDLKNNDVTNLWVS
jgi:2,3-bisphosphoglycerate-dependent phosphoglycerate mutase